MADPASYPGTPRWVKVQWPFLAILVLAVIGMATGFVHHGGSARDAGSDARETPLHGGHR